MPCWSSPVLSLPEGAIIRTTGVCMDEEDGDEGSSMLLLLLLELEVVEVGETGSGGSSSGPGGDDGLDSDRSTTPRLAIRSSKEGRALSRGLPKPSINLYAGLILDTRKIHMLQCAQTTTGFDGIVSLLSHPTERAWSCLCPSLVLALNQNKC